ncbi:MAG: hypothetical protein IMX00_07910 [Limnochordales bacterium]|nr:hypothetical protein [Limnochordales bacterium]
MNAEGQPKTELINDPGFQAGFNLLAPEPGQRVVLTKLPGPANAGEPWWDLAQWNSSFPDLQGPEATPSGGVRYANEGKEIIVSPPGSPDAGITLAVDAGAEYGQRVRTRGEPWVHLLVEQRFARPASLARLRSLHLTLEYRLLRSTLLDPEHYDPEIHTAQFSLFLTVQNKNRSSPGFGDYYWFGIPIYDYRYAVIPHYEARDFAGSGKFIFTPSSLNFTDHPATTGEWIRVTKDILPFIRAGLKAAWSKGYLVGSHDLSDYYVTSINIGWEVPGSFNVAMQLRNLSLVAE